MKATSYRHLAIFAALAVSCGEAPMTEGEPGIIELEEQLAEAPPPRPVVDTSEEEARYGVRRALVQTHGGVVSIPYEDKDGWAVVDGDLILGRTEAIEKRLDRGVALRNVWFPTGTIRYRLDGNLTSIQQNDVEDAIAYLRRHTPLTLIEDNSSPNSDVLQFEKKGIENWPLSWGSYCGLAYEFWNENKNKRKLILNDKSDCTGDPGTVLHEFGHGLGFPHEHQRSDRNDFVSVDQGSNFPWNYWNYWITDGSHAQSLLSPFDFASLMLYRTEKVRPRSGYSFERPRYDGRTLNNQYSIHDINSIYRVYGVKLGTNASGDLFGHAVATGDFDDDGIEDVVTATNESISGSRRIQLYFYKGVATDPSDGDAGFKHAPWFVQYYTGSVSSSARVTLAAGDYNGDGITDLAIGAPFYNNNQGRVTIWTINTPDRYVGEPPWGARSRQSSRNIYASTVGLPSSGAHRFGAALETGRLTNGSRDELLVGAPDASHTMVSGSFMQIINSGGAVVHIRDTGNASNSEVYWAPGLASANFGLEFGDSIARVEEACSTSSGKYDTFVVGAPGYSLDRGRIYEYGCSKSGSANIRASNVASLSGPQSGARFGDALDAIKIREEFRAGSLTWWNTDRFVAVGVPEYTTGGLEVGKVYLYELNDPGFSYVDSFLPSTRDGGDKFGERLIFAKNTDSEDDPHEQVKLAIAMPQARDSAGIKCGKVYVWRPWESPGSAHVHKPYVRQSDGLQFGRSLAVINNYQRSAGFVIGAAKAEIMVNGVYRKAGSVHIKLNDGMAHQWVVSGQVVDQESKGDRAPWN